MARNSTLGDWTETTEAKRQRQDERGNKKRWDGIGHNVLTTKGKKGQGEVYVKKP